MCEYRGNYYPAARAAEDGPSNRVALQAPVLGLHVPRESLPLGSRTGCTFQPQSWARSPQGADPEHRGGPNQPKFGQPLSDFLRLSKFCIRFLWF